MIEKRMMVVLASIFLMLIIIVPLATRDAEARKPKTLAIEGSPLIYSYTNRTLIIDTTQYETYPYQIFVDFDQNHTTYAIIEMMAYSWYMGNVSYVGVVVNEGDCLNLEWVAFIGSLHITGAPCSIQAFGNEWYGVTLSNYTKADGRIFLHRSNEAGKMLPVNAFYWSHCWPVEWHKVTPYSEAKP